ncbi:hypothetical protein L798_05887 [Zootermopsis nevadensis]|uniref:Uncharacterized protein n=1 Tax=Zootermopsis nevadensis TaxID=136037 RepID=A0A067RFQ2_ZOONE|nr:hypothetical protein L798_05887 [Zootermopsis nevadensis]
MGFATKLRGNECWNCCTWFLASRGHQFCFAEGTAPSAGSYNVQVEMPGNKWLCGP